MQRAIHLQQLQLQVDVDFLPVLITSKIFFYFSEAAGPLNTPHVMMLILDALKMLLNSGGKFWIWRFCLFLVVLLQFSNMRNFKTVVFARILSQTWGNSRIRVSQEKVLYFIIA